MVFRIQKITPFSDIKLDITYIEIKITIGHTTRLYHNRNENSDALELKPQVQRVPKTIFSVFKVATKI